MGLAIQNYENQALQSIGSAVDALYQATQQEKSFNRYATLQTQQQERSQQFKREENQNQKNATATEALLQALGRAAESETDPKQKEFLTRELISGARKFAETGNIPETPEGSITAQERTYPVPKYIPDVLGKEGIPPMATQGHLKIISDLAKGAIDFEEAKLRISAAGTATRDRKRQDDVAEANVLLSAKTQWLPVLDPKTGAVVQPGDPDKVEEADRRIAELLKLNLPKKVVTAYQRYSNTPEFTTAYTMMQMKHPELTPIQVIQAVTDAIEKSEATE